MVGNCSSGMPPQAPAFLNDLEPVYIGLTATCGVLTLGIIILYFEQFCFIYQHLQKWPSRHFVMFVLSLYPVYSLLSIITMLVPRSIPINDMVSGMYIAICLYIFLQLFVRDYGGKATMIQTLVGKDMPLRSPPVCCCCCCLPTLKISKRTIHILEGLVLQYGIYRIVAGYIGAVSFAEMQHTYDVEQAFSRGIIMTCSTLLAMYGIQLLFRASLEPLKDIPLRAKFLCIQLVLIIDNFQNLILSTLGSTKVIPCANGLSNTLNAYRIHRMITVVEVLILSIIARNVYRGHLQDIRKNSLAPWVMRIDSESSVAPIITCTNQTSEILEVITNQDSAPDVTLNTEKYGKVLEESCQAQELYAAKDNFMMIMDQKHITGSTERF